MNAQSLHALDSSKRLGLMCEHTHTADQVDDMEEKGRRILAASFSGGLRYMREKCANAYALRMKHGIPDVFVTFTCNGDVSSSTLLRTDSWFVTVARDPQALGKGAKFI